MKYTLNEHICEERGLTVPELLLIFVIKGVSSLQTLVDTMILKGILTRNEETGELMISQGWNEVAEEVILSSDNEIPEEDRLSKLATSLMELYPKGKKEGTSTYWRGNKREITCRLQKFFKLYDNKYTDEELIEATRKYVQSFNGNYSYMRVLKYFIWKDIAIRDSEDSNKSHIVESSDLATYIENAGQEDTNDNWLMEGRNG